MRRMRFIQKNDMSEMGRVAKFRPHTICLSNDPHNPCLYIAMGLILRGFAKHGSNK